LEEERHKASEARKQSNAFGMVAAQYIERHVKGPAYVDLERLAHEFRAKAPSIPEGKALARVMADPKHKELVARSRKEGIVKKGEAVKIIEGEFIKRWEARPITEIMPDEAAAAIRAIVKRGAPYQAHNAFGYLRGLFNWAIGTGEFGLSSSPVERLQPAKLIGKREARIRILSDDELRPSGRQPPSWAIPTAHLSSFLSSPASASGKCRTCIGQKSTSRRGCGRYRQSV
jgi:hypothetical protein